MSDRTLYDIIESDTEPAEPCEHLGGNRWVVIVEPCKDGNYAPHQTGWSDSGVGWWTPDVWCDGLPEADDE